MSNPPDRPTAGSNAFEDDIPVPHRVASPQVPLHALGGPLSDRAAEHVADCPTCQADLAAYTRLTALMRGTDPRLDVHPARTPGAVLGPADVDDDPEQPPVRVWQGIEDATGAAEAGGAGLGVRGTGPGDLSAAGAGDLRAAGAGDLRAAGAGDLRAAGAGDLSAAGEPAGASSRRVTPLSGRRGPWTQRSVRTLLASAAAVLVGIAGLTGWLLGRSGTPAVQSHTATAALSAQPGTADSAHGHAVVRAAGAGYTLTVQAAGLPAPTGFYEVWLYNPNANSMVAVGTLGVGERGSFTVPARLDLNAYRIVDVSAQRFGQQTHQRSVLQGTLVG